MASNLSNIIVPQTFFDYTLERSTVKNALLASGVVAVNPLMSAALAAAGDVASMLSFKNTDAAGSAANVSTTDPAQLASAEQVTGRKQNYRRLSRNKGFASTDLEAALLSMDPAAAVAAYASDAQMQWRNTSLFNIVKGCINETVAPNLVNTVGVEATGSYTSATQINSGTIIDTVVGAWGDFGLETRDLPSLAIFMHPLTKAYLAKTDFTSFDRVSSQNMGFDTYNGMLVFTDETLPKVAGSTSGFKYTTYIVKAGAINFGYAAPKNPVEVERTAAGGNGGGAETLWVRDNFAFHINGFSMTGAQDAESVTDAVLGAAANWTKVLADKQIGVCALVHNLAA